MRKVIVLAAALALLAIGDRSARASEYDDSQSHPLRLLAYVVHPVGYTLEWLVTRPFHQFVSQPDLEPIFGHRPHGYFGEGSVDMAVPRAERRLGHTHY